MPETPWTITSRQSQPAPTGTTMQPRSLHLTRGAAMSDQPTEPGSGPPPATQPAGWGVLPQQPPSAPPGWGPPPQSGWGPPPRPKKHTGRNILLGLIVAFLALGVIGALVGDPATQQPAPNSRGGGGGGAERGAAGDDGPVTLAAGGEGITRDIFGSETATIAVSEPEFSMGSEFVRPSRGVYALFTVAVVARKDNVSSPEFYVLVNGEKFDREHFFPSNDRNLQFTSLQRGQSQTGVVAFDLPARHGQLIVPGGDGKPQVTWTF